MQQKIGVLGLGVFSTAFYVSQLHQKYHQLKGGFSTFPFLMYQVDFELINPFLPNQFEKLMPKVQEITSELEKLPVQKWIIPNITLHETFDKLETKINIIHPIEVIVKYCNSKSIHTLIIFGTKYTMNSDYLSSELAKKDINILKPEENDMLFVDELRTKIYQQKNTEEDLSKFKKIIKKYTAQNYILIACTELSIIADNLDSEKLVDIAKLQIEEAIHFLKS